MPGLRPSHLLLFLLLIPGAGCSERLLRENVFANTETGVGIFINQNRQTQAYEGKLGYFRHELFLVPTNKVVNGNRNGPVSVEGPMDQTPEVLADIAGSAGLIGGDRATIRQRLAVGRLAVNAPAAIALMSDSAEEARAVAEAVGSKLEVEQLRLAYDLIANAYDSLKKVDNDPVAAGHVASLDGIAEGLLTPERRAFEVYQHAAAAPGPPPTPVVLTLDPGPPAVNYQVFASVLTRIDQLRRSQLNLGNALHEVAQGNTVNFVDRVTPVKSVSPISAQAVASLSAKHQELHTEFVSFDTELRSSQKVIAAVNYYQSLFE